MRETVGDPGERGYTFFVSIDHAFISPEHEALVQQVYSALGALDAASPAALAPLRRGDLQALIDAGERWSEVEDQPPALRESVIAAARRLRHVLDRR